MPPANDDHTTSIPLAVTLGRGLRNPQGQRLELPRDDPVEALRSALESHAGHERWWSPNLWGGDRRKSDAWEGAACVAVDLDYYAPGLAHSAPPPEVAERIKEALPSLPGSFAHLTPRGVRVVWFLEQPVADRGLYERLSACAAAELEGFLGELDLLGQLERGDG
jgi:hypothetical protein